MIRSPIASRGDKQKTNVLKLINKEQRQNTVASHSLIKSGIYFGNFMSILANFNVDEPEKQLSPKAPTIMSQSPRVFVSKQRYFKASPIQPVVKDVKFSVNQPKRLEETTSPSLIKLSKGFDRTNVPRVLRPKTAVQREDIAGKLESQFGFSKKLGELLSDNSPEKTERPDVKTRVAQSQHFTVLKTSPEPQQQQQQQQPKPKRPQTGRNQYQIKQEVVTMDRFDVGEIIGTGSYAVVRVAKDKVTGKYQIQIYSRKVAIKCYERKNLTDMHRKFNVKREVQILSKLKHPNIVALLLTVSATTSVNLVMEYVSDVSLRQYIKSKRYLEEDDAKPIFRQIMLAVNYIHERNVIHRDLKLENVMIDKDTVKLIDFGFSIMQEARLNVFCGTPSYMAPEIVLRQEYFGKPADIWAAGILLYALLHGYFPFKGKDDEELFSNIKSGEFRLQSSLSGEVQSLIQRMLSSNANDRITAQEVLDHKWLCN